MHFLPFVEGLGLEGERKIAEAWVHTEFDPHQRIEGRVVQYSGADLALLKLVPLKGQTGAVKSRVSLNLLPAQASANSELLGLVSYGFPQEKPWGSLWQSRCNAKPYSLNDDGILREADIARVFQLSCTLRPGQSGALIQSVAGGLVGVVSASVSHIDKDQLALGEENEPKSVALFFDQPLIGEIVAKINGKKSSVFRALPILSTKQDLVGVLDK